MYSLVRHDSVLSVGCWLLLWLLLLCWLLLASADMSVLLLLQVLMLGGRGRWGRGRRRRELDRSARMGPELRGAGQGAQPDRHQGHEEEAGAARVQRARARPAARLLRLVQLRCNKRWKDCGWLVRQVFFFHTYYLCRRMLFFILFHNSKRRRLRTEHRRF